jgi:NADP-dependent 3-hydroxy acid dehydrogenase YdfG
MKTIDEQSARQTTMAKPLEGIALVTRASTGIGEAVARLLAGLGAAVALAARRKDRLDDPAAEVAKQGGRALVLEADITEPHGRERNPRSFHRAATLRQQAVKARRCEEVKR